MRKLLGLIGVVAACGACCALPLLLPVLGGLAAGGAGIALGWELMGFGVAVLVAVLLAFVQHRRRQSVRLGTRTAPKAENCGCRGNCPAQKGSTA